MQCCELERCLSPNLSVVHMDVAKVDSYYGLFQWRMNDDCLLL
jgi:hypothetical protein